MNRQKKEIEKQKVLLDISPIDNFRGKFFFLSNFWPVVLKFLSLTFESSEAFYQAMKAKTWEDCKRFQGLTAAQAKRLGNEIEILECWEEIKIPVMKGILSAKFSQEDLRRKLQETSPRPLVEGNNWHDTFWGVCQGKCRQGPHKPFGKNMLGILLMEVRDGKVCR